MAALQPASCAPDQPSRQAGRMPNLDDTASHLHTPDHVFTPRALRRRPHPQPERSFPEGPSKGQDQPVHRHLLRRRRAYSGAGLRAPGRGADAGRQRAEVLSAHRGRGSGPNRRAAPAVRGRPRGRDQWPRGHAADRGLQRRAEGGRRLPQALVPRQRLVGERPHLGQPPRHVRGRGRHGAHLPLLRRRHGRAEVRGHAADAARPARAQHRAAARLLPQPHGRGPDPRAVGGADPGAARA